jgi:xRRM domain
MELVVGKREEFYWEKVPEKIRRQAVEKAFSLMHPTSTFDVGNGDADESCTGERRRRKRRKH